MTVPDLNVIVVEQQDPRLGRQCVHDPRSRSFAAPRTALSRRDVAHRVYDPLPNPSQPRGNCTGCAEAMMGNAKGNRRRGQVLRMDDADRIYSRATQLDPWPGSWPPTDTGSSGLAAAKAAVELGHAASYEWYFGVDHTLDGLQHHALSAGTWWTADMMPTRDGQTIRPTGGRIGGHQWVLSGYDAGPSKVSVGQHKVRGSTWWGGIHHFWLTVDDFAGLLADDGDVHFTRRRDRTA